MAKISKAYSVDISQGGHDGALSHQWYSRPDDERFLSLEELSAFVNERQSRSFAGKFQLKQLRAVVEGDGMYIAAPTKGGERLLTPTNWGFSQLCSRLRVGQSFLTDIPSDLAVPVINHYLDRRGKEDVKIFGEIGKKKGDATLFKAANSPAYGRIYDSLLVDAVIKLVEADPGWKIPGTMDWRTMQHNPNVTVTKQNTTLYASDRDVWLFLCKDANPVQAGVLPNGEPDWYFPGFYCWNSEVGAATLGIAVFWLRAVCENRNLWGIQDRITVKIKHSKNALDRFIDEVEPLLLNLINKGSGNFVEAIETARNNVIAVDEDERHEYLKTWSFTKGDRQKIIDTVWHEEGEPLSTVFHAAQGVTALARTIPHQNRRIELERIGERMLLSAA